MLCCLGLRHRREKRPTWGWSAIFTFMEQGPHGIPDGLSSLCRKDPPGRRKWDAFRQIVLQLLSRFVSLLPHAPHQAPLSSTISWSLLKFLSIESVMLSNHLVLCCPLLLLPSISPIVTVFSKSHFFTLGGQSIGVTASTSVLPMNIQD